MKALTETDLYNDLAGYIARAIAAEHKLASIKKGKTWREKKKEKAARRILQDEIKHVEGLIKIAEEALIGLE